MKSPIQITFRNTQASAAVETRIQAEATKLNRYYSRITSCRVIVEAPHRHHKRGELFHVRIELNVPGAELVVGHEPAMHRAFALGGNGKLSKRTEVHVPHKDVYVAVRDAFRTARRQLEEHIRRLRGEVKMHTRVSPFRAAKEAASASVAAVA